MINSIQDGEYFQPLLFAIGIQNKGVGFGPTQRKFGNLNPFGFFWTKLSVKTMIKF